MTVNKLTSPISQNDLINKTNEIIDNLGSGGGANTDLSNLTATGEAHFQEPLVSGTNIKTINNASILGSGNIDTQEVFVAEYGVTSYADVLAAYNAGKKLLCKITRSNGESYCFFEDKYVYQANTYFNFVYIDVLPDSSYRTIEKLSIDGTNHWQQTTYNILTNVTYNSTTRTLTIS